MTASVAIAYCASLIKTLDQQGILHDTLQKSGIDAALLDSGDNRISFQQYVDWWSNSLELSNDPLLGLRVGAIFHPGNLGALASVLMSAPSLAAAIEQLIRFEHVLQDGMQTHMQEKNGSAYVEFICPHQSIELARPLIEKELSEGLALARFFLQGLKEEDVTIEAHFQHCAAGSTDQYKALLGDIPIKFSQKQNQLIFDASVLSYNTQFGNEAVFLSVLKQIDQQVEQGLAADVKRLVAEAMHQGVPEVKQIAEKFDMSYRTFQRRLSDEGHNYKELVAQVRQSVATELLANNDCSIGEIAYLVGFTEASTFHQAFKRWTGQSPGEYRKTH